MGLFFSIDGFTQSITVLDSASNTKLANTNIIADGLTIVSDIYGLVNVSKVKKTGLIEVRHLGYKSKFIYKPTRDTTLFLTENVIRLGEVTISNSAKNTAVVGNFEKKTNNVFVNSRIDKDIGFTLVNKWQNYNSEKVNSILFYIFKDENYLKTNDLAPMELVFFKLGENGLPQKEPFYKIIVGNYSIGWNKVVLHNLTVGNEDAFFYGIRWIYDPIKYHYKNVTKEKTYHFFGCKLGVVSKDNPNFHPTFFYNLEKGWKASKFSPVMMALEILK